MTTENNNRCNCFSEVLDKVKSMASEQLSNTPMVKDSLKVEWKNRVFFLDGNNNAPVSLKIETEYLPIKKDGTPAKSKKKLENNFKMSHCPFCGTKY